MLLCARGHSRTNPKKPRAGIFLPGYPVSCRPCMQKFSMPFATTLGHQFFRIFAEAYLLTGKEKNFFTANSKLPTGLPFTFDHIWHSFIFGKQFVQALCKKEIPPFYTVVITFNFGHQTNMR